MKYLARDLVHYPEECVASLSTGHIVVFDDGTELKSSTEETLYSYWFWDLFKPFPNTKILPNHHLRVVLKGKALNRGSCTDLCTNIFRSICIDNNLVLPQSKEATLDRIYRRIAYAMTQLVVHTEENVVSLDILDFIQIDRDPEIERLRAEAMADTRKIKYAYDGATAYIQSNPAFYNNGLAKALRAGMVKPNQVMQCVMFRGIMSEVDGAIFSKPNWSNYTRGNTSLFNYVGDSRTAAKSHYYSDAALQDSEYMARKFQLFSTVVEHIVYEDCQSTRLVPWTIGPERKDSAGATVYGGDLPLMIGKYYLDEETNTYKWIDGTEKHLIGKTIRFRSMLYCNTPNPHHVCHICAGKLSENVSRFANIGHLGAATTTKDLTQSILSIKHVNTSSVVVKILLQEHERQFMNAGEKGNAFYFNTSLKNLKTRLVISREEAVGLVSLADQEDLSNVSLPQVSELSRVQLVSEMANRAFEVTLDVTQKNKHSMLSREMLKYLKENKWATDSNSNFVVDLDKWDYALPAFVMPNKEESFVELAAAVDTLVRSSKKMIQKRLIDDAPSMLLREIFDLVNSKMKINIFSFEILVYALMVESNSSYALARGSENPVLGIGEQLTKYRSLGQALAYEGQDDTLTNPMNYIMGTRPDSPLDVFMAPHEVVTAYPGQ